MNEKTLTEHRFKCKGGSKSISSLKAADHSVQLHEMMESPLYRIEACYIQKKKQVELLQTEVTRLNDKIMQLEDENARLQKIIALHHESAIQEAERVQEIHALFVENL